MRPTDALFEVLDAAWSSMSSVLTPACVTYVCWSRHSLEAIYRGLTGAVYVTKDRSVVQGEWKGINVVVRLGGASENGGNNEQPGI